MIKRIKKKCADEGMSMLYVLAALIVTGFIASAMVKMMTSDRVGNSYYSTSAAARSAAKSGVIASVAKFEAGSSDILALLQRWINSNTREELIAANPNDEWILGSSTSYATIGGVMKYRTKLVAFDSEKFNIKIVSEGEDQSGARAMVTSLYHLDGLGYPEVEITNWGNENALFVGTGTDLWVHGEMNVDGNVYFGNTSGLRFDSYCAGSIFHKNFIIDDAATSLDSIRFDGKKDTAYEFKGPAYFGTRLEFTGNTEFDCAQKSGFRWGVAMKGSGNFINTHMASLWNGDLYGNFIGSGKLNGFNQFAHHNGDMTGLRISYVDVDEHSMSGSPELVSGNIDIQDSLGVSTDQCEIKVNPGVILEKYITEWHWGSGTPFTAERAQKLYDDINTPKWHGFLVLRLENDLVLDDGANAFDGKIIILVNGFTIQVGAHNNRTFNCLPTTNFTIVNNNAGKVISIGGWEYYRGFMWAGAGSTFKVGGAQIPASNIFGAIYAASGVDVMEWYPPGALTTFITYDPTVLEELDHDGFLTKINCTGAGGEVGISNELSVIKDRVTASLLSQSI